jgi:hypothetical protein
MLHSTTTNFTRFLSNKLYTKISITKKPCATKFRAVTSFITFSTYSHLHYLTCTAPIAINVLSRSHTYKLTDKTCTTVVFFSPSSALSCSYVLPFYKRSSWLNTKQSNSKHFQQLSTEIFTSRKTFLGYCICLQHTVFRYMVQTKSTAKRPKIINKKLIA